MFRRPGTGRSKASSDTLCQKCLKRGHYSYECKATAQERPYQSRPSRTQQLLNPKLKPKLTTDVPEDLLRKKGVADEILKKKEQERAGDRKRSRSLSTSSADSVSTISTNRSPSRSRSPPRRRKHNGASIRGGDGDKAMAKRRRRSVSQDSRSPEDADRNTRRRMSSFSPGERGRRRTRSRSVSQRMELSHEDTRPVEAHRRHRRSSKSRSRSRHRHGKRPVRRVSPPRSKSRSLDRMDTSDDRQPRNGASRGRWGASRSAASRSPSPFRPGHVRSPSPRAGRNEHRNRRDDHGPSRNRFDSAPVRDAPPAAAPPPPPVQRERSLSPFSKRVALTRAMQAGR